MQKMKIAYSAYKYAPETARATVNGVSIDLHDTMIPEYITTGQKAKAEADLKKAYRKQISKKANYIYIFFAKDSKQFYYVSCLNFKEDADLKTRLYNYKELKHHLQTHPIEIITESGTITPSGAEKPEVNREVVTIDFSKCRKIKIAM